MLLRLSIENYALIDRLEMELSNSLNIITGETGAGKSILLGALGLLLGNRADVGVIKDSAKSCSVEGVFDITNYGVVSLFEEHDLEYDDQTIVRRVISSSGKSRAYINDLPVSLSLLKSVVGQLIDIHSQHQTLMLANEEFKLKIVDSVANNITLRGDYYKIYSEFKSSERELAKLKAEREVAMRDHEWLKHQTTELKDAKLRLGEQSELEEELSALSNSDDICSAFEGAIQMMNNEESGILRNLKSIGTDLNRVGSVYPSAGDLASRVNAAYVELKDLESEFSSILERIDANPERIETIEQRLNTLYSLQQKHRVNSEQKLISLYNEYSLKLSTIDGNSDIISALESKVTQLNHSAKEYATKIHDTRKSGATNLKSYIEEQLSELDIPNGVIEFVITPTEHLKPSGADDIQILFSANRNLALQPIEKSASGGELSRVMLAIKAMMARSSQLPTIIFDEIDTGVSGQIADKMGQIINSLANDMQVINITHLPQVAAKGETHWMVYKDHGGESTSTHVVKLTAEQRINEIAKMLSGSTISDAAREQAKLLLSENN